MIKALIIDDEQKARSIIQHYITNFIPQITEIKQASSVEDGLAAVSDYQPDIVFLDVEMPFKNGFDFLSEIKNPAFDVIFTTAYNEYAIQAIRFSALDYLLKPVDPDELVAAVDRYINKKESEDQKRELYKNLKNNIEKKDPKDFRIAVPTSNGVHFFSIDEVIRLEADTSYTLFHLVNKKPFMASKTLKHFDEMLEGFDFIRTHKSHLVNARHIKTISSDHDTIFLSDGSNVEISRRKKEEVFQHLKLK
ncbi:MAG: response regulator transcription factor [Saprospiraceae bacterium]|nr:response regulator transcription factor [Saprospiraceae bacterium]